MTSVPHAAAMPWPSPVPKTRKLYCFVDETGQDTEGRLFIVAAVVVAGDCHALRQYLEQAERQSGLGKKKWVRGKAAVMASQRYFQAIDTDHFKDKIFYGVFTEVKARAYQQLSILAMAQAVSMYRERHQGGDKYKVSVTIDGLKSSEESKIGRQLRYIGLRYQKVRGARDESEAFLRLADRIAGLVRDVDMENKGTSYQEIRQIMERQEVIHKL